MKNRALFTSASKEYATPKDLLADLDAEFHFTFDPCPLNGVWDGLYVSWAGKRVFCNPPYSRKTGAWLAKAREAELAVYLLPSRTDTKWWHEYAMQANEIRFIRGRLKFSGKKTGAPFPSVLLVYDNLCREGDGKAGIPLLREARLHEPSVASSSNSRPAFYSCRKDGDG